jgi:RNA recognition motif-containing protein
LKLKELKKQKRKRYVENKKKKWFEQKENVYIYVTGLPLDCNQEEVGNYFRKCGVFKLDPATGDESIKLYTSQEGVLKGDCRIGFAK